MPRHRAPSTRHHALSSFAVTGAAFGASLLSPVTAAAAPSAWTSSTHPARPGATTSGGTRCDDLVPDASGDSDEMREALADAEPGEVACVLLDAEADADTDTDAGSDNGTHTDGHELTHRHRVEQHRVEQHRATRPMTSGEHQQRNGCLQGYIVDDCERFSVSNLLRHGIDPFQ